MLNDKYIAGLIDSDGSVGLQVHKRVDGTYLIRPRVTIKQVEWRAQPLHELAEEFGTKITIEKHTDKETWNSAATFVVTGDKALRLIERIHKHLVIKCDVAKFVMHVNGQECTKQEVSELKQALKNIRNSNTSQIKNYPSRKWLAGYFDGDGMVRATLRSSGGVSCIIRLHGYKYDRPALELLKKVFGGSIHNKGELGLMWNLSITVNNIDKVIGYFAKHSIIKKAQLEYVLGYIRNGKHLLRRGEGQGNAQFVKNLSNMKSPASTK